MMTKKQATISALACAVFVLDGLTIAACWIQAQAAGQRLEARHELIERLEAIESTAQRLGTITRTSVTGEGKSSPQDFEQAESKLHSLVDSLPPITSEIRIVDIDIPTLRSLVEQRLAWEHHILDIFEKEGKDAAVKLMATRKGAATMQTIRERLVTAKNAQKVILQKDTVESEIYRTSSLIAIMFLTIAGAAALWQAIKLSSLSTSLETDRSRAYDRLEQLNNHLNKQVSDLMAMQQQSEKALLIRSQFLARISHELRTPLAGIIGATSLALDGNLPDEEQKLIELANSSGRSMLELVDDILDFENLQHHSLKPESLRFDLPMAISSALEPLRRKAEGKGLGFSISLAKDVPTFVFSDRLRLQQILINLVDNAIKFTSSGTIGLAVTVEETSALHATVRFTVSDTGMGIEHDLLEDIWEPFIQADGTSSRKFGGSGLGLSIAKKLVELLGGKIGVASLPGKGSQFFFKLALDLPAEVTVTEIKKPQPINQTGANSPI